MKKYQILASVLIMLICLESMFRVGYSIYPAIIILLELIILIVVAFDKSEQYRINELTYMYETEVGCNLKQRDKIGALEQELYILRQKYSRTNQPRSGGEFVEKESERETAEDVFKANIGKVVTNLDGFTGNLCGYCTGVGCGEWDEFIIGLNNENGFIRIDEFDIISNKYKSYKYCSYQDILNAKFRNNDRTGTRYAKET